MKLMVVHEGVNFVVLLCQFPKVAVNVVGIATFGFQLNGHMFDAELRSDSVPDQLQKL